MHRKVSRIAFSHKLGTSNILILVFVIIIALAVDTSIVRITSFTGGLRSPEYDIAIFSALTVIFALGQYMILGFVRRINEQNAWNKRLHITQIHNGVSAIQYVLIGILASLILQMVFTSSYNLVFVELVVCVSYILALVVLGFLLVRLLSWFKSNHKAIVLAYSIAIMSISINAIFTVLYVTGDLMDIYTTRSTTIQPAIAFIGNYNRLYDIFNAGYVVSYVSSFALTWAATVILLRNYSRKIGTARYWVLVSIPLLYFLSQFGYVFLDLFTSFRISHPILFGVIYTLFFSGTVPAGGILFGIAFWNISRNISSNVVKQYMMISAYGMMILFSANQAYALVRFFYPPFGLVTFSFFGLASYLIFIGIYSSAVSVAQDSELRKSIRSVAVKESGLLDSIGTAQMEQEIEKRVLMLAKRNQAKMTEETGIQSSLSEDDMKEYLMQVIQEVQKRKSHSPEDAS